MKHALARKDTYLTPKRISASNRMDNASITITIRTAFKFLMQIVLTQMLLRMPLKNRTRIVFTAMPTRQVEKPYPCHHKCHVRPASTVI